MTNKVNPSARFVRSPLPPFPIPMRLGSRLFNTRYQVECHKADLMGLERPPEPTRIELVSVVVAAAELGISLKALKRRIDDARRAAEAAPKPPPVKRARQLTDA